jgi:hypothetical protein
MATTSGTSTVTQNPAATIATQLARQQRQLAYQQQQAAILQQAIAQQTQLRQEQIRIKVEAEQRRIAAIKEWRARLDQRRTATPSIASMADASRK